MCLGKFVTLEGWSTISNSSNNHYSRIGAVKFYFAGASTSTGMLYVVLQIKVVKIPKTSNLQRITPHYAMVSEVGTSDIMDVGLLALEARSKNMANGFRTV